MLPDATADGPESCRMISALLKSLSFTSWFESIGKPRCWRPVTDSWKDLCQNQFGSWELLVTVVVLRAMSGFPSWNRAKFHLSLSSGERKVNIKCTSVVSYSELGFMQVLFSRKNVMFQMPHKPFFLLGSSRCCCMEVGLLLKHILVESCLFPKQGIL